MQRMQCGCNVVVMILNYHPIGELLAQLIIIDNGIESESMPIATFTCVISEYGPTWDRLHQLPRPTTKVKRYIIPTNEFVCNIVLE